MDQTRSGEVPGIQLGIGNIVSVRQKDVADAAPGFKTLRQPRQELWRIDEPVATVMTDEVAVAAIGLRRVISAIVNFAFDPEWEVLSSPIQCCFIRAANG